MQCAGIIYSKDNAWTYRGLDVTPLYSVQYTRYSGAQCHVQCTVYKVQWCTVCERAGPQQEGKQDCWAAEDQPGEHLQELLSLYVEQSPCLVNTHYCPGTCSY